MFLIIIVYVCVMANKEKVKNVSLSLTPTEEIDLKEISQRILGKESKSGIVRLWINQNKTK